MEYTFQPGSFRVNVNVNVDIVIADIVVVLAIIIALATTTTTTTTPYGGKLIDHTHDCHGVLIASSILHPRGNGNDDTRC
jgi:hypothetical protein